MSLLFLWPPPMQAPYPPTGTAVSFVNGAEIFPMKNKATNGTLLPTNAPYPFYDWQQLELIAPRKGSFTVQSVKATLSTDLSRSRRGQRHEQMKKIAAPSQRINSRS